jgi:hypothetical protein
MASPASALIACRVLDGAGAPLAGARVYFVSGPGAFPDIAALTDDDGAVLLAAPTPGTYGLQAAADGYATETAEIVAVAGETAACEIVLMPA